MSPNRSSPKPQQQDNHNKQKLLLLYRHPTRKWGYSECPLPSVSDWNDSNDIILTNLLLRNNKIVSCNFNTPSAKFWLFTSLGAGPEMPGQEAILRFIGHHALCVSVECELERQNKCFWFLLQHSWVVIQFPMRNHNSTKARQAGRHASRVALIYAAHVCGAVVVQHSPNRVYVQVSYMYYSCFSLNSLVDRQLYLVRRLPFTWYYSSLPACLPVVY